MTLRQIYGTTMQPIRHRAIETILMIVPILAACSQPDNDGSGNTIGAARSTITADRNATSPAPTRSEPKTFKGDNSTVRLNALSSEDIRNARLTGELACGFAGPDGNALLHAAGNVGSDKASGVVKVDNSIERVSAAGGFDGMVRGGTFTGAGKTIKVRIMGNTSVKGQESPPHEAALTLERADGVRRTINGTWTCGP